jgi:glycerate dehydrogenase
VISEYIQTWANTRQGKRIEAFARALGMQVLISDRKDNSASPNTQQDTTSRVPFAEVLKRSTVLMVLVPKMTDTLNLISTKELQTMNPHAVIVNISRGGIIDETAMVAALRGGSVAGYATDVFESEPAEGAKDSPLLAPEAQDLNLTLTPHVAWFGERTRSNLVKMLQNNIELFIAGTPQNLIE